MRTILWTPSPRVVRIALLLVLLAAASAVQCGCQTSESDATSSSGTEVVDFEPALPTSEEMEGECFSVSLAVMRSGAYRCSVGNAIHDPCFAVEGDETVLVCGAYPTDETNAFLLRVKDPLPEEIVEPNPARAWMVELNDGTICELNTGATGGFDGERLNYGCDDGTWILGELQPGDVWTARRVTIADEAMEIAESEDVDVHTVWR